MEELEDCSSSKLFIVLKNEVKSMLLTPSNMSDWLSSDLKSAEPAMMSPVQLT